MKMAVDEAPDNTESNRSDLPPSERRESFCAQYGLTTDVAGQANMSWVELDAIWHDHISCTPRLTAAGRFVVERLQAVEQVHSIRFRVKDPDHLVAKLLRKRLEDPKRQYTLANYKSKITDLIGVRALHLFKEEWRELHRFVTNTWRLKEKPTANIRAGDSPEYSAAFRLGGCRVKPHKSGYRSVHYLLMLNPERLPITTELQVRTLFEEGWSEIDHRVRYPHGIDHPILAIQLGLLNRLAGSADEMGSFVTIIRDSLNEREHREGLYRDKIAVLETLIRKLKIEEGEKKALSKELHSLPNWTTADSLAVLTAKGMFSDLSIFSEVGKNLSEIDLRTTGIGAFSVAASTAAAALNNHLTVPADSIARTGSVPNKHRSVGATEVRQSAFSRCTKCGTAFDPKVVHICPLPKA